MKMSDVTLYKKYFKFQSYPWYRVKREVKKVGNLWKIIFHSIESQDIYGHAIIDFL